MFHAKPLEWQAFTRRYLRFAATFQQGLAVFREEVEVRIARCDFLQLPNDDFFKLIHLHSPTGLRR